MATLVNISHKDRLAKPAADSYARMRVMGMPAGGINSALRTRQEQENEFFRNYQPTTYNAYLPLDRRVYKGVAYYRKRGGVSVSVPGSSKSRHEKGLALDIATASAAQAWLLKYGASHGWHRPLWDAFKQEPWHWEYRAKYDKKPKPTPQPKEEDMPSLRYGNRTKSQKLVKDRWTTVKVTDKGGVSTAFGAKVFDTDLILGLKAPTDTQIRVRAYKMNYKTGKRGYTYDRESKTDSPKTTGSTLHFLARAKGECSANERIRFEAYTWNDNVMITSASYRTSEWN